MNSSRIVIDTNVFVSGLRTKQGMSHQLLSFLDGDLFQPVVTVPLVVEYEKSLCDPKVKVPFTAKDIRKYLNYVFTISDCRKVYFLWRPYLKGPKDDMVLEAAVSGQCEYIVTFNTKDFKNIEKFGIAAITPGDFLRMKGELK